MLKIPPATKEFQDKLIEAKNLMERLENGKRMLNESVRKNSLAPAFEIIKLYSELARELLQRTEELGFIVQMQAFPDRKIFLRQNGTVVSIGEVVSPEDTQLSAYDLQVLREMKNVFGEVPHDILRLIN